MRAALYARYSSDNQRDASIEDQLRLCREHAQRQGWTVIDSYSDRAISGASLLRPGVQELMEDASRRRFDVVLAEAMDRISRDQEDIAGFFKRMTFAQVRIITLSEGDVTHLHVGLKGTMNALFLQDLAMKTRRGLRGRVEAGKSGGGNSYGYAVVRKTGPDGQPVTGERVINADEAAVVRHVFEEFASGKSPKQIAKGLNADLVPAPDGGAWGFSTILGNAVRGTGLLRNQLYVGKIVWNRQRYVKDPDTGKRISASIRDRNGSPNRCPSCASSTTSYGRRSRTGWTRSARGAAATARTASGSTSGRGICCKCGCCGGGFSMVGATALGCSTARNRGTCSNLKTFRRDRLEQRVLAALRGKLMDPALFAVFCEEFTREMNRLRIEASTSLTMLVILVGTAGGMLLGLVLSRRPVAVIAYPLVDVVRSLPPLVLILFMYYLLTIQVIGVAVPAFWVCVIAMSLNLAAFTSDRVRAAIANVPREAVDAGRALGMTERQITRHVVLPRVFRELIPGITLLYIAMLKMSSLASIINVREVVHTAQTVIADVSRSLEAWTVVAAIYVAIVVPATYGARAVERWAHRGLERSE